MQRITIAHGSGVYREYFELNISQGLHNYELDFDADGYRGQFPNKGPRYEYVKSWLDTSITNGHNALTAELFQELMTDIMDSEYRFRSETWDWDARDD